MDSEHTSEYRPGQGRGSRDSIRELSPENRNAYERECERLEERFHGPWPSLATLINEIECGGVIRFLVLTHLGKLWLDHERALGNSVSVASFLEMVPELIPLPQARADLEEWSGRLNDRNPPSTGQKIEIGAHTFFLPEEYELLHGIQDDEAHMCLVFVVNNRRLKRREVLKAINPARHGDALAFRRFVEEPARASQTLHHAIVRVYHASPADIPCPYYTMEYLEGGSLANLIQAGPLSTLQAARYIAIVARALHHVHRTVGIAHGDLKPENILLDRDGNPKITDFGLSRSILPQGGGSITGSVDSLEIAGTVGYIAPEQIDSQYRTPGLDPLALRVATDLFALTATLYRSVTGQLPYQSDSARPQLFASLTNELVPALAHNPAIDAKLDAICRKGLSKSPQHRFATAAELADALEAWLSHQTLDQIKPEDQTFRPMPPKPASPEIQTASGWSTRQIAAVAAATLLVVMAGGKLLATKGDRSVRKIQNPEPRITGSSFVPRAAPGPAADSPVARFTQSGWRAEPAQAVIAFHEPWLAAIREVDPQLVDNQLLVMARLGRSRIPLNSFQEAPHHAAMMAMIADPDEQKALAAVLKSADSPLADRLLTLYPSSPEASSVIGLLQHEIPLIRDLSERGWIGCESAFLSTGETPADQIYHAWLQQIVRGRLVTATTDETRRQAAEFQAYAVINGPALFLRLTNDSEFRARFPGELWPAFSRLIDEQILTLTDLMEVDQIWDYLANEGDPGFELLRDYKLAPVALLYGPRASDFEGLHDRVVRLLKSGNKSVVQALFETQFRGNAAFRKLVEKDMPEPVLAVVLNEARKNPALLNDYATWSVDDLQGEFAPLWKPELEKQVEGRVVYLTVPIKYLTGQRVYSYENKALAKQAVYDVATAVLMYFGVSADVQNAVDMAYWAVNLGLDNMSEARRKETLKEISGRYQGTPPSAGAGQLLKNAADVITFFEQTHRMMGVVGRPDPAKRLGRPAEGFDVAPILRMYKSLFSGVNPKENAADRSDVRLMLLENDQFAISLRESPNENAVRRFFHQRARILANRSSTTEAQREQAWRESASAWWLLHATDQIQLLGPLAGPSSSPAEPAR